MVRLRLVLLVTVAALLAPAVTPCLLAAPAGHAAMPCCHPSEARTPAARPCCALDGGQPGTPAPAAASLLITTTTSAAMPVPVVLTFPARGPAAATLPPSPSRRLSTILLI